MRDMASGSGSNGLILHEPSLVLSQGLEGRAGLVRRGVWRARHTHTSGPETERGFKRRASPTDQA